MDRQTAEQAIIDAGRRLGTRGLISAAEGNLSMRLDGERLLITPTGARKEELTGDDLVVVRPGHEPHAALSANGGRPTSDLAIHLAVYAARPDVQAVAHAHLPASMALTVAGEVPDPVLLPETALLLPRLPFVPYAAMGSAVLAERVATALTEPPEPLAQAVLLERHGAVAVGVHAGQAVDRLELIEVLCRTWRDALLVKAARAALGPAAILGVPTDGADSHHRTKEGA